MISYGTYPEIGIIIGVFCRNNNLELIFIMKDEFNKKKEYTDVILLIGLLVIVYVAMI